MLKICIVFWESEPQYAYKRYAYKKKTCIRGVGAYLRVALIRYICGQGGRLLEGVLNRSITVHKLYMNCINTHYNHFCKETYYET